jgi:hypothetical protein
VRGKLFFGPVEGYCASVVLGPIGGMVFSGPVSGMGRG